MTRKSIGSPLSLSPGRSCRLIGRLSVCSACCTACKPTDQSNNHRWAAKASQCARLAATSSASKQAVTQRSKVALLALIPESCGFNRASTRLKTTDTHLPQDSGFSLRDANACQEGREACWEWSGLACGIKRWMLQVCWRWQLMSTIKTRFSAAPQVEAHSCLSEPVGINKS